MTFILVLLLSLVIENKKTGNGRREWEKKWKARTEKKRENSERERETEN
jgi:hypothetical protein